MLNFKTVNRGCLLLALLLLGLYISHGVSLVYLGLLAVLWLVLTTIGSFHIRWNYHIPLKHRNPQIQQPWVALSFDDGPDPKITPQILALLKKHHCKATFFCVGQQIAKHPEILQEIINQGHSIGNHSYTHSPQMGFFSTAHIKQELEATDQLVKKITGLQMQLFRPCYGVTNPHIAKAVTQTKHHAIGWQIRSLDTTQRSAQAIYQRVRSRLSKGDIVLLHDNRQKTIEVLEHLLRYLDQEGLTSVTVDRLLNIKGYEN